MSHPILGIHIKNNSSGEEVFRITPERFEAAAARHPKVAKRVSASIEFDLHRFDECMADAVALVTWDVPSNLADRAPNLRWIHIIGAGVEHLQPFDWLPHRVILTNNRGVHVTKSGEFGMMALLMLNNAIPRLGAAQRNHEFIECYTTSISAKTLLVLGAGHMGSAVAARAKQFGMNVIGIRRTPQPTAGFDEVLGPDGLDDALPHCDFLLVTAPDTPATRNMIDERRLGLLKPGAGIVNMGRAAIVDYVALADALRDGTVSGAVLDVFDPEPLPRESPLWDVPNLMITPHMSSDDAITYTPDTLDLVFENLELLLTEQPLKNQVDPAAGY